MNLWNKVVIFFRRILYWKKRYINEKAILRDLELVYEIHKEIYEYNCAHRNIVTKMYPKVESIFFHDEEILRFELYFSLNEEKEFKKIGVDIEQVIRKFEKGRWENFLVTKEYARAKYTQESKKIEVNDRVLRYSFYSQVYKRNFRPGEKKPKKDLNEKKAINFFDYYES